MKRKEELVNLDLDIKNIIDKETSDTSCIFMRFTDIDSDMDNWDNSVLIAGTNQNLMMSLIMALDSGNKDFNSIIFNGVINHLVTSGNEKELIEFHNNLTKLMVNG